MHTCVITIPLQIPNLPLPGPLHIEFLATFSYNPPILLTGSPSITLHSLVPLSSSLATLILTLTSQLPLTDPLLLSQLPPDPSETTP